MAPRFPSRSVITLAATILIVGCSERGQPVFVGSAKCASCHAVETAAWRSSQHAFSMQDANAKTVLGKFDSTLFESTEARALFFRRDEKYFVNTLGEDGGVHDYEIAWTFGVYPLQQYIVKFPGGRMQALTVAWDSRSANEGGQRWFFLTPGHGSVPSDPLHWTGREYNWNYSCADCHSTAVRKNYDERTNTFRTTFAEINVACESCHGAGSIHAGWGRYPAIVRKLFAQNDGLANRLDERHDITWTNDGAPTAHRSAPRRTDREIETCAQCHSRRTHIADDYTAGSQFFNYYIPATIAEMYYPDGQQRGEVYNYASFLQSRMYSAGVTCSDCHDPHTAKLRLPGNQVCGQCHTPSRYDTQEHRNHPAPGPSRDCVSCHMPSRTYMEIDARLDHSMRIPRPDRSVSMAVPNACNDCHTGKTADWAAEQIRSWYPQRKPGFQTFAEAFAADNRNDMAASRMLADVANDSVTPWLVRASALGRLARHADSISLAEARRWIRDSHPLVRLGALQILDGFGEQERLELALPMLSDTVLTVRKGAAWIISPIARSLGPADRKAFDKAADEFVRTQLYNADQPGDRFILGLFYEQLGDFARAESSLVAALKLDPGLRVARSVLEDIRKKM